MPLHETLYIPLSAAGRGTRDSKPTSLRSQSLPFRAKNPKDLFDNGREPDNVWQTNIAVIKATVQNADLLVAAYGGNGK